MIRRRRPPESSLELLLDTICNTFGGVLFLAILVSVLLQMTARVESRQLPTAQKEAELRRLQRQHHETMARLQSLRIAAAEQRRLRERLDDANALRQLAKIEELEQYREGLANERHRIVSQAGSLQTKVNRDTSALNALANDLAAKIAEVAKLEETLADEVAKRTEATRLPTLQNTTKLERTLCLRYGKLYQLAAADGSYNTTHFEVVQDLTGTSVSPKPSGGFVVKADGTSQDMIKAAIASVDATDTYLAVFVWSDSFHEFRELKKVMVDAKFEYRLEPVPNGVDSLRERASGPVKVLR